MTLHNLDFDISDFNFRPKVWTKVAKSIFQQCCLADTNSSQAEFDTSEFGQADFDISDFNFPPKVWSKVAKLISPVTDFDFLRFHAI